MIDRSTRIGLFALAEMRRDLEHAVASARSYTDALDAVQRAINGQANNDAISAAVAVPAIMSDLGGRLMVYGGTQRVVLARGDDELAAFLTMPFEEAIAIYKERVPERAGELETLLAGYRVRGVQARQMMLETLREKVTEHIVSAMEEGTTFGVFRNDMNATLDSLGITPASPSYLETVFRTNIQGAYGAGRWAAMRDPEVASVLPFWQYRAVGDGRTRDNHMALDGLVFEIGNPKTDYLAPPGGFNCRCSAISVRDTGQTVTREVPPGGEPDEGFAKAPGMWIV